MKKKFNHLFRLLPVALAMMLVLTSCSDKSGVIPSPDRNLKVDFAVTPDGIPVYSVTFNGEVVITESPLGIIMEDEDYSTNMRLASISALRNISDSYEMINYKMSHVEYRGNERVYSLLNENDRKMDIIFRVSDDGVGFRYFFPEESSAVKKIDNEVTSYAFHPETRAWLQPINFDHTGWERTNPSYEEFYLQDIPVGTPSPMAGWVYPALFNYNDTWILITEAGIERNYCATRLHAESPNGVYTIDFPMDEERTIGGELFPESTTPWYTPWRIMAIGDMKTIIESTLQTDFALPAIDMDQSFIKPALSAWSWAKLKDESVNYDTQIEFIDYAADMNWPYVLVDVNWDQNIGYDRIAELADYAAGKDVSLLLWYNSSGDWNTTPYTPKSALLTREQRRQEFARISAMGVKGVKVDFFAGDGQSMMVYYQDLFEDAAEFGLLVNCHGATLPRGWHRTYPNLMTIEAVKGFEYITFDQRTANVAANHGAMQPFTRNVWDPMDWTPTSFDRIPNIRRITTVAHELALVALFQSGIQHIAETPDGMATVPEYVREYMRVVPSTWDDTKFIDGFPGKDAILARRSGNTWYISGINGEDTGKSFEMDLSFLEGQTGYIINDGAEASQFVKNDVTIPSSGKYEVTMKGNGGFAMVFEI